MLPLLGLIVLIPLSVRLALWGRRRALPRSWLAWLPLAAPVAWAGGAVWAGLALRDQFSSVNDAPVGTRSDLLSIGIADALQGMLVAAIVATAVLAASFAFFVTRPRAPENG